MALTTTTLLALEQKLSEGIGDFLEFDSTTNIGAGLTIISTTLKQYDLGRDDHFNEQWVYITEGNNIGVLRRVSDYATAGGTLTVYGANLAAETGAVTCRLGRYDRTHKINALEEARKTMFPTLHRRIDDITLITGNILPDAHFESWSSATALNWFTATTATIARTSTAGETRGGTYAAKVTASAANGYIELNSDTYPRLLDLQDRTVDFYCRALPQTANDGKIEIYTKQADGTAQTLTSTTTNPAGEYTKLELEQQTLNDDLAEVKIRFKVATNGQYVIFDDAYLSGFSLSEYLSPDSIQSGAHISQIILQTHGHSDEPFYDLHPFSTAYPGEELTGRLINTGTYQYLKLNSAPSSKYRLRLIGMQPLESLSSDTDTVTLDTHRIPLLVAKARVIFWEREIPPASPEDKVSIEREYGRALMEYQSKLRTLRMMPIPEKIRV